MELLEWNSQCVCFLRGKVLQESLIKLVEACGDHSDSVDRWLSKLENSKWLSHVHNALATAGLAAECVERYSRRTRIGLHSTLFRKHTHAFEHTHVLEVLMYSLQQFFTGFVFSVTLIHLHH